MGNIKYLHVMTHPATFFNSNIIRMFNDKNNPFKPSEHLFLVSYDDIYNECNMFTNVVLVKKIMTKNLKIFNKYARVSEIIFLHHNSFYDYKRFICVPNDIKRKIVWCVWGPDLYTDFGGALLSVKDILRFVARKIGSFFINMESKYYKAIGIGFRYDALEIKHRFKHDINIVMCPYPSDIKKSKVDDVINNYQLKNDNSIGKPIRIMVAHSAHPYLNHKKILDKLSAYKNENIIISLVLSYGNKSYGASVEKYAYSIFGNKVEIIRNYMSSEQYLEYLASVDIAIFDQKIQSGLGNLYYLLYMGKKVYLNKDGILKLAMNLEGVKTGNTNEIGFESFLTFSKNFTNNERGKRFGEYYINEDNLLNMWLLTFDLIKDVKN